MSHGGPVAAIGARLLERARALRIAVPPCPAPAGAEPMRTAVPASAGQIVADLTGLPDPADPPAREVQVDSPAQELQEDTAMEPREETETERPGARVCYVYGIVPARTRIPPNLVGTGGGEVRLVRYGGLAGVISEVPAGGALGTRPDLLAHENVVASLAARTTMLPLRFSAVVTTPEGVVDEMLEPYYDWFSGILADLEGRTEFGVSGTYVQDTVLREVIAEEPEVMRLRERLRGLPEDAGYYERVRLGELIVHAIDAKREIDTEELIHTLSRHAVAVAPRPPAGEDTAADAAFLVADEDQADFRRAVDELGYRWAGRIKLRVLGPLAPYDFVPSPPGGTYG